MVRQLDLGLKVSSVLILFRKTRVGLTLLRSHSLMHCKSFLRGDSQYILCEFLLFTYQGIIEIIWSFAGLKIQSQTNNSKWHIT